ncbi:hypothetical protein Tco_1331068 [Tanacetum coccineum]
MPRGVPRHGGWPIKGCHVALLIIGTKMSGGRYEVLFIRGGRECQVAVRGGGAGQSEHDTCPKRVIQGCQACVSPRLSCGDPRQ